MLSTTHTAAVIPSSLFYDLPPANYNFFYIPSDGELFSPNKS